MSQEKKVKITLKGAGLSYETEISAFIAGQVMAICFSSEEVSKGGDIKAMSTVPSSHQTLTGIRESVAEYLNRYAPKRNPDKILTFASFLKEIHKKDSFQKGEIKGLFRDAGEITPANLTRDFKWTISSGWIAPDPTKKESFYVTNTGFEVLKSGFSDDVVKKSKYKYKPSNKRKKSKQE